MSLAIGIFENGSNKPIAWIGGNLDDFTIVTELQSAAHFARAGQAWITKAKKLVRKSLEYKDCTMAWDTS